MIRIAPRDADPYSNRGAAYLRKGDYDHAFSDFDRAMRLDPNNFVPCSNRGAAYLRNNDLEHAISDLDHAVRLVGEISSCAGKSIVKQLAVTYLNRGKAYQANGEVYQTDTDLDEAADDFEQALTLEPSLAEAQQGLEHARALLARRPVPDAQTDTPFK